MTIRDNLARSMAGGPQFRLQPDKMLVEVQGGSSLSDIVEQTSSDENPVLDEPPVGRDQMERVGSKLNEIGLEVKMLENLGTIVASAERLDNVLQNIANAKNTFKDKSVQKVRRVRRDAQRGGDKTILGGVRPGMLNFGQDADASLEAKLRNRLSSSGLKNEVTGAIEDIDGVLNAEVSYTRNTPGPRNLGVDPDQRPTISSVLDEDEGDDGDNGDDKESAPKKPTPGDVAEKTGVTKAWEITRGEGAVVAVFDTSFCAEYLDTDRVIDTFHGDDVESAFSAPEEGHGTMTAYGSAGNKEESGLDYNGMAPDADLLLARVSDKNGGLSHTEEAWNWLIRWINELDRPVISNHSYGVPLCSGRGMSLCNTTTAKIAEVMNQRPDHQAFYAAGNEGMYCGHRLSGITNGINGVNSKPTSITVGALRYDLRGAQNYSSHGFGTCNSVGNNPKPDVSCMLSTIVPYGCKEKDMGSGNGGSSGGTSLATPFTAGMAALMASVTGTARRSVLEGLLEATAKQPRTTQVNALRGHDARFGHGQVRADAAVAQAAILEPEDPPNAVFTYSPDEPEPGQQVDFDASASTDPDEDIEEYRWQFGDGTTSQGETASHTYEAEGEYRVVLTVTDSLNNKTTKTKTVNVKKPEPETPENGEGEGQGEQGNGGQGNGGGNGQNGNGNNGQQTQSVSGPLGLLGN
jgi:plastocyanin